MCCMHVELELLKVHQVCRDPESIILFLENLVRTFDSKLVHFGKDD